MKQKYDIFISYRRDGGESTAKMLRDKLDSLGYRVFFDVESLCSGNFNTALYSVIDECKDFILVLSPNALDRCSAEDDWVRLEIEHALKKGCNIIPILLRGFSFPEKLPESINEIRYKNGIESNYQFFDAFMEKLQNFLLSSYKRRPVFKKFLFGFAVLFVILAGMGSVYVLNGKNEEKSNYPYTNDERNVTGRFIYYVEANLQQIEQAAGYIDKSYQAYEQYLAHINTASQSSLLAELNKNRDGLKEINIESSRMSQELQASLANTPFSIDDANDLHVCLEIVIEAGICDIDNIELMVEKQLFDNITTEEILKNNVEMLNEEMRSISYDTNQLLLPIQNVEALEEFKYKFLPELYYIPLQASNWSDDEKILENDSERCENTIREIDIRITSLVSESAAGNENKENETENLTGQEPRQGISWTMMSIRRKQLELLEQKLELPKQKSQLIKKFVDKGRTVNEPEQKVEQEAENPLDKSQLATDEMASLEEEWEKLLNEMNEVLDEQMRNEGNIGEDEKK